MIAELSFWRDGDATWALYREDGRPVELRVECDHEGPSVGTVVKGRVARVLPGYQAAFVDIGGERNGFLQSVDLSGAAEELLVQVEREALSGKGPRLTTSASIAGWRLVRLADDTRRTVSRRIRDKDERARLRPLVEALPGECGFIARTAAVGADEATLRREADSLEAEWRAAIARGEGARAPLVLIEGPDLILRSLQSTPAPLDRVIVDRVETRDRLVAFLERGESDLAGRIEVRETTGARRDELRTIVEKTLRPKVWLRSGGYLVIEPTEALTSVDVNMGKFLGKGGAATSALRTNREAAAEIARQLRLRDIGGLVVMDFIQMDHAEDRRSVLEVLREGLVGDPSRIRLTDFSDLGLVELARTRTRESPAARLSVPCAHCAGRGTVRRQPPLG